MADELLDLSPDPGTTGEPIESPEISPEPVAGPDDLTAIEDPAVLREMVAAERKRVADLDKLRGRQGNELHESRQTLTQMQAEMQELRAMMQQQPQQRPQEPAHAPEPSAYDKAYKTALNSQFRVLAGIYKLDTDPSTGQWVQDESFFEAYALADEFAKSQAQIIEQAVEARVAPLQQRIYQQVGDRPYRDELGAAAQRIGVTLDDAVTSEALGVLKDYSPQDWEALPPAARSAMTELILDAAVTRVGRRSQAPPAARPSAPVVPVAPVGGAARANGMSATPQEEARLNALDWNPLLTREQRLEIIRRSK